MKRNSKEKRVPKYSYDDKKQIGILVVMAVVAVALLFGAVSRYLSDRPTDSVKGTGSDLPTVVIDTTVAPVTSSTVMPTYQTEQSTDVKESTTASKNDPAPTQNSTNSAQKPKGPTKAEILKKVSDGINSLKAKDASYKGSKKQIIDIKLTDCSVPAATKPINKVLELFMGEEKYDYDFTNGVAKNPEEKGDITTDEAIPPSFKAFALTAGGVKNATIKKEGENTVYTVELITEDSKLGEVPPHHSVACDIIKLEELNIPAEITKADYTYSGTKISVTYNNEGKVIRYHEYFDMHGVGEGHALGVTASCTMEGYIDEVWDISWK